MLSKGNYSPPRSLGPCARPQGPRLQGTERLQQRNIETLLQQNGLNPLKILKFFRSFPKVTRKMTTDERRQTKIIAFQVIRLSSFATGHFLETR